MNNEQMIILAKNIKEKPSVQKDEIVYHEELTNFDIKRLKSQLNDNYKLCFSKDHTLWELHNLYPKLDNFWVHEGRWWGR